MLHSSTLKLVDTLYELTRTRSVAWIKAADGRGIYRACGYEVEVCSDPCQLRVLRQGGRALETASATELAQICDEDGRSYDRIVRELAIDAVRIASGLDRAIEVLLDALELQASQPGDLQDTPDPDNRGRIVHLSEGNQRRSGQAGSQEAVSGEIDTTSFPTRSASAGGRPGAADYSAWT